MVKDRGAPLRVQAGQVFELQQLGADTPPFVIAKAEATLGRSRTADVPLDSDKLSRVQCVLRASAHALTVEDAGSGCGTFVNGERVQRRALHENDVLLVADFRFRVAVRNAGEATPDTAKPPATVL